MNGCTLIPVFNFEKGKNTELKLSFFGTSGLKTTVSRLPDMMTVQIVFSLDNPNSGWSNNEYYNIFLPQEYRITLAIDSCYYTDVHILDSKLVKNAFTRFRVPFYSFCVFNVRSTLSIIVRRCLNSRSGRTLSVDRPLFSALHLT